jgi:hypothetical protein
MRRLAPILLLLASAEARAQWAGGGFRASGGLGRGGFRPLATATATVKSIGNALQSGDKVGNWWALQQDGTMLASSALTESGQASPGVSPLTFNGTTQYFKSANVAYPTGDFSAVVSFKFASNPGANAYLAAKWDSGSLGWVAFLDTSGKLNFIVADSAGTLKTITAAGASSTNTWLAVCVTYTSASKALSMRALGTDTTGNGTNTGVHAISFPHSVGAGGAGGAGTFFAGNSRGVFFTETPLSDAACDRIMAGVL